MTTVYIPFPDYQVNVEAALLHQGSYFDILDDTSIWDCELAPGVVERFRDDQLHNSPQHGWPTVGWADLPKREFVRPAYHHTVDIPARTKCVAHSDSLDEMILACERAESFQKELDAFDGITL